MAQLKYPDKMVFYVDFFLKPESLSQQVNESLSP